MGKSIQYKKNILVIFFLSGLLSSLYSDDLLNYQEESYVLTHFSIQNSIPGQSVQCIFEDSRGILWLGIESVGLSKYNGKNHVVYSNNPNDSTSLSNNYPTKILEDDLGFIWVATANGLNRLNKETEEFKQFYHSKSPNSINNNVVGTLEKDKYGNIWISTANGINIYNPYQDEFCRLFYNENEDNHANLNYVHSIHINENIWIGTSINGLFELNGEIYDELATAWKSVGINFLQEYIDRLEKDKNIYKDKRLGNIRSITSHSDTIWIAAQTGIFYFLKDNKKFTKIEYNNPEYEVLNNSTFYSLLIDSQNTLWGSGTDNGIVTIDLNEYPLRPNVISSKYETLNNLKTNNIREIIESKSGLIWITTKFGGIFYFDRRQRTFPSLRASNSINEGLYDSFVTTIIEDDEYNIWFGTKNGGITKLNTKEHSFSYIIKGKTKESLPSNRVEYMTIDNDKTIWIGTDAGLVKKEYGKNEFEHFPYFHVRFVFNISDEYIWLGTGNGIFRFSKKTEELSPINTKHNDFFDKENNIGITNIIQDGENVYWIATNTSGLFRYNAKEDELINYLYEPNNHKSLCGNQVRGMLIDDKNNLWIGTKSAGLCLYDRENDEFILKSNPSVLPSNTVYHIIQDDDGLLWLGTHEGVSSYNIETNKYTNYSTIHGLQSPIFEINSHLKTHDGKLLMGGNQGVNFFDPKKINLKETVSNMIISSFNVHNEPIAIDITEKKYFKLESKNNYLSFEFALLDYSKPDENKYKYILEPFDQEWIESGTRNFASYTNLPPGEYTFKADASKSYDSNKTDPIELRFTIKTPLWKEKWFVLLSTIIIVTTFFMIYRLKILAANRRETELKNIVQKRTQDLYAAYQKLSNFNKEVEKQNKNLLKQRDQIAKQNIELEMHRTQLQSMVLARTKDLENEKIKAQESDRLKSAFLANMSHEIRTPLNAIMGFLDLMQTDGFSDDEKRDMNIIIQQNGNDLLQLINDIIDISIIEANQLVVEKKEVNMNHFIKDLINTYCTTKNQINDGVELITELPENSDDLVILTDPRRLKQIYLNLINNAIKFTEKGYIKYGYTINKKENKLECFVEDTGIGISEENQKLLFKRFHKIEPSSDKVHRGTGLGLSISKNLCKLLGGSIYVESSLGKGSRFYFYIPLIAKEQNA